MEYLLLNNAWRIRVRRGSETVPLSRALRGMEPTTNRRKHNGIEEWRVVRIEGTVDEDGFRWVEC